MGAEAPRQGPSDLCEGQQGGQCGWSGGLRGKAIRKMTKSRFEKSCGGKQSRVKGREWLFIYGGQKAGINAGGTLQISGEGSGPAKGTSSTNVLRQRDAWSLAEEQ